MCLFSKGSLIRVCLRLTVLKLQKLYLKNVLQCVQINVGYWYNQSVKTFSSSPTMAWQHFLADAKIIFIGLPTQSICHPFNCISIICLSLPTPDPYKPDSTVSCYLFSWLTKVHLLPPFLQSPAQAKPTKIQSHGT